MRYLSMFYDAKFEEEYSKLRENSEKLRFIHSMLCRIGERGFLADLTKKTKEEMKERYGKYYLCDDDFPWGLFYKQVRLLKKYNKRLYVNEQVPEQLDSFYVARLSLEEALKKGITKRQWLRYRIEYLNLKREAIEEYKSKEKVRR